MKRYIFYILIIGSLNSCTDSKLEDVGFTVKSLPAYVSYGNTGGVIAERVFNVSEGTTSNASRILRIEAPGVITSDITVQFAFGGNAILGTDFTVAGLAPPTSNTTATFPVDVTPSGGSIVIRKLATRRTVGDFEFVSLRLSYPTDGVKDGNKTLTITLTSAVGSDGKNYAVGRGGTDILKIATINIRDIN